MLSKSVLNSKNSSDSVFYGCLQQMRSCRNFCMVALLLVKLITSVDSSWTISIITSDDNSQDIAVGNNL